MKLLEKLPFLLLLLMVALLVAATFIEHHSGTATAYAWIYGTWSFRLLWLLIVLSGAWCLRRLRRRPAPLLLHLAFVVVLLGALCTALTGQEGMLHLRQGETSHLFKAEDGRAIEMPFEVALLDFKVHHYPGTTTPRDYESLLLVEGEKMQVSMNAIGQHRGYRFYQSSYDSDAKGSVLAINYDPWGTPITYVGYALLLLSMLWLMISPKEGFRRLLRHPALRSSSLLVLLLFGTFALPLVAHSPLPVVPVAQADSFARAQVVYNGRVAPFNTLARDFCTKLTGRASFRGLTAEQLLLSILLHPEAWEKVPLFEIKHQPLRERLGIAEKRASMADLYRGTTYRLQGFLLRESPQSPMAKAIQELDEKVALVLMLHKGTLIERVPLTQPEARLSEWRITLELLYNRLHPVRWSFMALLALGLLAFGFLLLRPQHRAAARVLRWLLVLAFLWLALVFVARWLIAGYVPMSNGPETMLVLALFALLTTLALHRRLPMLLPFGFLIAGFALLVAHLSDRNPQITSLMPVLASPWLSLHVTVIMMSYALFALMAMTSGYALWLQWRTPKLAASEAAKACEAPTVLNRLLLYPAVFLLAVGIFVGAIWANQSWGRYWAWDPKEVWALITLLLYSFALHGASLPMFRKPKFFHAYLLLAFLSVVITYFGVNFFLGGRHSYA